MTPRVAKLEWAWTLRFGGSEYVNSVTLTDAEVVVLRTAASALEDHRPGGTLYVTLEPCLMCMGALVQARVGRVVFATRDPKAGAACSLYQIGNDLRLEHEIALFDVAAGMAHLRDLGYEKIVLLGNSGGAGLYTFYNQQALTPREQRIARTPGGRPTHLGELHMPEVDGFILVSPHPGQVRAELEGSRR